MERTRRRSEEKVAPSCVADVMGKSDLRSVFWTSNCAVSVSSVSPDKAVHLTSQLAREVAQRTLKFVPDGTGQSTTTPAHDAAEAEDDCVIALALKS